MHGKQQNLLDYWFNKMIVLPVVFYLLIPIPLKINAFTWENSHSEIENMMGAGDRNAGNLAILPDTVVLKQLLKTGMEKRKQDQDSAFSCFNKVYNLCLPLLENKDIHHTQKGIYSGFCIDALNNLGLVYYFICNYDSAMFYFNKAHVMARKFDNRLQIAGSLFYIAEVHLEKGNFENALDLYIQSKSIYDACGDAKSVFYCYNSMGILAKLQGDYFGALDNYSKALNLADSLNDELSKADIFNNMGNVYKSRGEYARAMENFDFAYTIFSEQNELLRMSDCLNNIGDIHKETGNYLRALEYYKRSIEITEKMGDNYRKVGLYKNIGEILAIISDFGEARLYFEKAISLAQEIGDRVRLSDCYKDYGQLYEKQGNYNKAVEYYQSALKLAKEFNNRKGVADINLSLAVNALQRGKTLEAIVFANKGYEVSQEIGALKEESLALKILSDAWVTQGDSSKAFFYFKAFSEVKDTLVAIGQMETIEKIEARHQLAEKEKENRLLKAESEIQQNKLQLHKLVGVTMAVGLVLLGFIIFLLFRRIKDARMLYHQKETINQQKVNELNRELDFKNRDLTAKALHLVQKDELLSKISEKLYGIMGSNGNAPREINNLIWELKADLQKNNWDEFEHHFLNVHPGFYLSLNEKYPALTTNEKKICAFLKLNLKTKEIAAITGQSVKSIEVARTRLRSKFRLRQEENLNSFICAI